MEKDQKRGLQVVYLIEILGFISTLTFLLISINSMIYKHIKNHSNSHQNSKAQSSLYFASKSSSGNKRMTQTEFLFQTSWPTLSYFHSDLDQYCPNMGFYVSAHHDFASSINSSPENSTMISLESYPPMLSDRCVDYPLGYDQMQNQSLVDNDSQNIKELDDVCRWLCDDDQGMEEIPSGRSTKGDDVWRPGLSMKSSVASELVLSKGQSPMVEATDVMHLDSQTGLQNLLKAYADAMGMGQRELAKVIVRCITEKINPTGPTLKRIAFNLFQFIENQEEEYLRKESMRNFKPAFRAFYNIFPYGRFAHFTANSAILEAVPSHVDSVHIVDFDMGEGTQWPPVIEAVARRRKSLTITSVKLEEHNAGFEETKRQLSNYARCYGLNLKVEEMELARLVKGTEETKLGRELLAFNCMIGLPHMGRTRRRNQVMDFLRLAKRLVVKNEGIITFGNGEYDDKMGNFSDYTSFFDGNLAHYKAIYESMEWGFPSYLTKARIAMETLFIAPFISSLSWFQKWEEGREDVIFLKDVRLKGRTMSRESLNEARELVKEGESPYRIRVEGDNGNEMVLEWGETPLVKVSTWM